MADDIRQWLEGLELGKYSDVFVENEITPSEIRDLSDDDLKELGLPMGPRKRLLRAIDDRVATETAPAIKDDTTGAHATAPAAERRQLTVMFCDLVGSTVLSRQLDPEDLREVMRRYQDAVAGAVTRYGGHVAKYLGDGVLAYFGWPQAYEDQAERAVRAGLDAVSAVNSVKVADERALESRVGIATGQVVVGDLVGEIGRDAEAVTGETPNLAARLQGVAEPGQIVIGEATHHLVGQTFAVEDLGNHELKGFDSAVRAWGIVGEIVTESRFEVTHGDALTRIVGRETELQLLLDRWHLAEGGEGQAMFISGEAGIGKSRLIQGLSDQVADIDHARIHYQCSPYHTNSALYPAIQQLERTAGFAPNDESEAKLDKLEAYLRMAVDDIEADAPLFAHLLSLNYEERYGVLEQSPQQIKERLLEALVGHLLQLAERGPVLFLFEDTHWIDPTSQELLERSIGRLQQARVLLVITHRPEWQPPPSGHNHVTSLQLNRLGKAHGADIVRAIAGDYVPDDVVTRIVARTDGVPLFIEELTKSLIEGGLDIAEADIPATLQASLLARLDRLGPEAKEIAQIGAVIGREFAHDLLAEVSKKPAGDLDTALDRLTRSELVFRTGMPPDVTYTFKHALIQDAAYDSLLRARRQTLHRAIAEALEQKFAAVAGFQPEIVAHHYTLGEVLDRAASFWSKAGQLSSERSAILEALAHAEKGLALLDRIPEGPQRDRLELDLNLTLGPALMTLKSYSAPEVNRAYIRARELCDRVGEPHQLFPMQFGWWVVHQMARKFEPAARIAQEMLQLAERQTDSGYLLQAHHANWTTLAAQSELQACLDHARKGVELYDLEEHRLHAFKYAGHDPGVCAWDHLAMMSWLLGHPDQAVESVAKARALADALANPSSQVLARVFSTWVHQYRKEATVVLEHAEAAIDLCVEHDVLPNAKAAAQILREWARAMMDGSKDFTTDTRESIEAWRATGENIGRLSYYQSVLAEVCEVAGRNDEAIAVVDEALENAEGAGHLRLHAAIYGQKGKLLLSSVEPEYLEAERCMGRSMELAQRINARSLELRTATSLAQLWRDQGKTAKARDLLAPVYGWFTEGFDTPDLKDAKALLDDLS